MSSRQPEQHSKTPFQIPRPIAHSTTWIISWDFFLKFLLLGLISTLLLDSIQYFTIISYLKLFGHTPWLTWLITFSEIFLKSAIHGKQHMHLQQWHILSITAPGRWQNPNHYARPRWIDSSHSANIRFYELKPSFLILTSKHVLMLVKCFQCLVKLKPFILLYFWDILL